MKINKEELIAQKKLGWTDKECAESFDCTLKAVQKAVQKLRAEGKLPSQAAEDYIAEKDLQTDPVEPEQSMEKKGKTVAEYLAEEEAAEVAKLAKDTDVPTKDEGICYKPVAPAPEQTPDPAANAKEAPYPIPPIDRKTFWAMRRDELRGSICEYACCGLAIDPTWVEEYNELIERYAG